MDSQYEHSPQLTPTEVVHQYESLREQGENITPEQLCDKMDETTDPEHWLELNWTFHRVFVDVSGWSRLPSILGSLRDSAAPWSCPRHEGCLQCSLSIRTVCKMMINW
jgi:hypothetical protein